MTILADMTGALDAAGVRIGGPRFFWRVGGGARRALEAELAITEADIATFDDRGAVETLMGFPVLDAQHFEGWELCPDDEVEPLRARPKRRKKPTQGS